MSCCKRIIHHYSESNRGVFCLQWVLPLRIITILSLALHLLYKFFFTAPSWEIYLTLGHIALAMLILGECRRSVRYHKAIKELDTLGDRRRALLEKQ